LDKISKGVLGMCNSSINMIEAAPLTSGLFQSSFPTSIHLSFHSRLCSWQLREIHSAREIETSVCATWQRA
jgi:hypothetical protein